MISASEMMSRDASRVQGLIDRLLTPKAGINHMRLYESMRYSALAGGKRLRPHLVYEFCRACGGNELSADAYAAGVELIHTYSLIHDDLPAMDDDDMRRGRPSNHKVYGEATAILAGDALLTEAFSVIANNEHCDDGQNLYAVIALAEAAGMDGMVGGQQIDIDFQGKTADAGVVSDLHMRKTGALITAACMLGCIAANAPRDMLNAAGQFGSCIGLAFQIIDDLLDISGSSQDMGKTLGKDTAEDKATFVKAVGVSEAKRTAAALTEQAKSCLAKLDDTEAKKRLSELCNVLLDRTN